MFAFCPLPPTLDILVGVFPLAPKKAPRLNISHCQNDSVFFCLGTQAAAGASGDAGEGQDVQAGPSTEADAEPIPTSPPTYSGEATAAFVDENNYFQAKSHAQTMMTTVKGTID